MKPGSFFPDPDARSMEDILQGARFHATRMMTPEEIRELFGGRILEPGKAPIPTCMHRHHAALTGAEIAAVHPERPRWRPNGQFISGPEESNG